MNLPHYKWLQSEKFCHNLQWLDQTKIEQAHEQNSSGIFWVFHLDYLSISAFGVPLVIVKFGLFYRHGGSREHRPLVFPQYNLAYNHFCHREHWAVFVWHYMEYQYSLLGNPINEGSHHHPRLQAANLSFRLKFGIHTGDNIWEQQLESYLGM